MTIIHDKWGEVEGVEVIFQDSTWVKNGAWYLCTRGWREKVEEQWEEDSGYLSEYKTRACLAFLAGGIRLPLPANKRWAVVERYALPPGWWGDWFSSGAIAPAAWVETFKRPCLIIERKVEGCATQGQNQCATQGGNPQ